MKAVALLLPFLLTPTGLQAQQRCQVVPIDGGSIRTCISGEGATTVVLAAGAGQASGTWTSVVPELARCARVITFDRPGFGASPAGRSPRTPTRIANELRSVIESHEIDGPIVLVGHSMGGVHVLRYATLFPDGIAAVVLLDTPPPGFEADRLTLLSAAEVKQRQRMLESALAGAPEVVRLERAGAQHAQEWDFSGFPRTVSVLVVVADSQDFGDLGSADEHRSLWLSKSRQWLQLSDDSELLVAEGSGHMVHQDAPDLVVEAVRKLGVASISDDTTSRKPNDACY